MDPGDLADMWRDAAEVFHGLQTAEAGAADKPDIRPLSKTLQKHVDRLVKLDSFAQTFSSVPVAFGMVELDKLVAPAAASPEAGLVVKKGLQPSPILRE